MGNLCYGLEDKIAVVTGGSRGIGLEMARSLLAEKARVVICGRKQDGLEKAAADLNGGDRLLTVTAHVGKEADVVALFETVKSRFGGVDIMINNVGMNLMTGGIVDTEPSAWQKIIDTNLNSVFLCSRAAAGMMKQQGGGSIVNITSVAGHRAALGMGIYGVAKAAIEMLTRVLAAELAPFKIRVNAVAPSMVKTDFSKPFWTNEEIHAHIVKSVPLGRLAEPIEVVHPALFLASEGAAYITGTTMMVDGGSTAI